MIRFDINCDVGEGFDNEDGLMPYIQSCNIACGAHAGDRRLMKTITLLAMKYEVKIGAHPSYPDRKNFGRVSMIDQDKKLLKKSILEQINTLKKIVENQGGILNHIKPHGALYNDIAWSEDLALFFLDTISIYKSEIKLFVPYNSAIERNAINKGFTIVYEVFADRNYNDDLSLVSRENTNALILDQEIVKNHVLQIVDSGKVTTITGKKQSIKATTFCVHSDTPNSTSLVKVLDKINKKII